MDCPMEIYLAQRRVPDDCKIMAAESYLDERMMDCYATACPRTKGRRTGRSSKRHCLGTSALAARDRLARDLRTGSVQDCLLRPNETLAECPGLAHEEKRGMFLEGLQRDTASSTRAFRPTSTRESIDLAVEGSQESASQVVPRSKANTPPNVVHSEDGGCRRCTRSKEMDRRRGD